MKNSRPKDDSHGVDDSHSKKITWDRITLIAGQIKGGNDSYFAGWIHLFGDNRGCGTTVPLNCESS
jgi:hypothetical protein